jgi:hypothetical protein
MFEEGSDDVVRTPFIHHFLFLFGQGKDIVLVRLSQPISLFCGNVSLRIASSEAGGEAQIGAVQVKIGPFYFPWQETKFWVSGPVRRA